MDEERLSIPYDVLHHEAYMSLHKELTEPYRYEEKKLNQDFGVSHRFSASFWSEPAVIFPPSQSSLTTKHLRVGFKYCDKTNNPRLKLMLTANNTLDGELIRLKYDFSDRLTMYTQIMHNNQPLQPMFSFDYKSGNYISQLQLGNNIPIKACCSKRVTPELSVHGEVSWNENANKDVGFAVRYARSEAETESPKMIAVAQVFNKAAVMSYFQKFSEKASFVAHLMYNYMSRDIRARVGCVYSVRRGQLLANIDSNGVFAAHLEEQLVEGLNFMLSTELDPKRRECKVGCGIVLTSED